jgi:hypothetical protein
MQLLVQCEPSTLHHFILVHPYTTKVPQLSILGLSTSSDGRTPSLSQTQDMLHLHDSR